MTDMGMISDESIWQQLQRDRDFSLENAECSTFIAASMKARRITQLRIYGPAAGDPPA